MRFLLILALPFMSNATQWERVPTKVVAEIRDNHANHSTHPFLATAGKKEIKLTADGKNYLVKLPNSEVEEILLNNGELIDLTRLSNIEIKALLKEARVISGGSDGGGS